VDDYTTRIGMAARYSLQTKRKYFIASGIAMTQKLQKNNE